MGEVSDQTVINCFHKCGFQKECADHEEEFASLVKELSLDVSTSHYIDLDMDVVTSMVDVESIAWWHASRQEAIKLIIGSKNSQENKDLMKILNDDDSEEIIDPMAITLVPGSLQVVDCVMRFSQQHGNEKLDHSLTSHWNAAGYVDNQQTAAKHNRKLLQISFVLM